MVLFLAGICLEYVKCNAPGPKGQGAAQIKNQHFCWSGITQISTGCLGCLVLAGPATLDQLA